MGILPKPSLAASDPRLEHQRHAASALEALRLVEANTVVVKIPESEKLVKEAILASAAGKANIEYVAGA